MAGSTDHRRISISRVLSGAVGVFRANPSVMFALTAIFAVIPAIALVYLEQAFGGAESMALDAEASIGAIALSYILWMVIVLVMQAMIVRATVVHIGGEAEIGFAEAMAAALPAILPLLGYTILYTLGVAIGLIFLIVPGVILLLMWSVGGPALIMERLGPIEALGRSRALTKGNRGRIFGLYLLLLVLIMIFGIILGIVVGAGAIATGTDGQSDDFSILGAIVQGAFTGAYSAFFAALGASLYAELRGLKEGPASEQLEEIFA